MTWLGRFLFCPEVIARGLKAAQAMQTAGVRRADKLWVLRRAQAGQSAAARERSVAQLVLPGHLDRTAPAGAVDVAAVLLRLPGDGSAGENQSNRGRPHRPAPGGLGVVYRPSQPPEFVQTPSRPENGTGTGRKAQKISGLWCRIRAQKSKSLGRADAPACALNARAGILSAPPMAYPPPQKSLTARPPNRSRTEAGEIFPMGNFGELGGFGEFGELGDFGGFGQGIWGVRKMQRRTV